MKKATDALLADHKMVRKLLEGLRADNPRYVEVSKTLTRVLRTHAWYEDTVLLPVLRAEPLFAARYLDKISAEHKDIDFLLDLVLKTGVAPSKELDAYMKQFRAVLDGHFKSEEDALFPLAQTVLDNEGLNRLSQEMENRQGEARRLFGV